MAIEKQEYERAENLNDFAGQYLTFYLGGEAYGIDILRVQEIIRLAPVTPVPRSPGYFAGIMNLRGRIVSVLDLRKKLGLPSKEHDEKTCIVVLNAELLGKSTAVGVIVDSVEEVSYFAAGSLQPPPNMRLGVDSGAIRAVTQQADRLVILIEIDSVLQEDATTFSSMANAKEMTT